MTKEKLKKMDERRQLKGRHEVQDRMKNGEVHRECNKREKQWLNEQCEEVEGIANHIKKQNSRK